MKEALQKVQNMPQFKKSKSPYQTMTDGTGVTTQRIVCGGRPNADLHPDFTAWYKTQ